MPTYTEQVDRVQRLEHGLEYLCDQQKTKNPAKIRMLQRKIDELRKKSSSKRIPKDESRQAEFDVFKIWSPKLKAAEARQDALENEINADQVALINAREQLSKLKPPIPKKPTKSNSRAHPGRADSPKTEQAKSNSCKPNSNEFASQVESREAKEFKERQKDAWRVSKSTTSSVKPAEYAVKIAASVAKPASSVPEKDKKKIEVKEPKCNWKGTMRGRADQSDKVGKRERSESQDEIQPRRPIKRARNDPVVRDGDESDDADTRTKRKRELSDDELSKRELKKPKTDLERGDNGTSRIKSVREESSGTDRAETSARKSTLTESDMAGGSDTPPSSIASKSAGAKSASRKKARKLPFKRIKNIGNSCFSAVYNGVDVNEKASFQEAFEKSKHSTTDTDCLLCRENRGIEEGKIEKRKVGVPKVGVPKLKSTVEFLKTPDSLIVSMGRCSHDGKHEKITSSIDLGQHEFQVGDDTYALNAAMTHRKGRGRVRGYRPLLSLPQARPGLVRDRRQDGDEGVAGESRRRRAWPFRDAALQEAAVIELLFRNVRGADFSGGEAE